MTRKGQDDRCHDLFVCGSVLPAIKINGIFYPQFRKGITALDGMAARIQEENRSERSFTNRMSNLHQNRVIHFGNMARGIRIIRKALQVLPGIVRAALQFHKNLHGSEKFDIQYFSPCQVEIAGNTKQRLGGCIPGARDRSARPSRTLTILSSSRDPDLRSPIRADNTKAATETSPQKWRVQTYSIGSGFEGKAMGYAVRFMRGGTFHDEADSSKYCATAGNAEMFYVCTATLHRAASPKRP